MNSRVRPDVSSGLDSENDLVGSVLRPAKSNFQDDSDDDFSALSFGALSSAQKKLMAEDRASRGPQKAPGKDREAPSKPGLLQKTSRGHKTGTARDRLQSAGPSDSELDDKEAFLEAQQPKTHKAKKSLQHRRNKHAPAEASLKRPVPKIREIAGLKTAKESTLYHDIRFDAAYGKADWSRIRKDYAFLDEYREQEIKDMQKTLKDKKSMLRMSARDADNLKFEMQSLKSRLDTLKNRDLASTIVLGHKKEQMHKMRTGEQVNPYFLKRSEQRKMVQKAKFDSMRAGQREKVMERKRKRRLGKEFKQLEFRDAQ
ncbi:DUF947-domain-containing protein [Metschnikowia bicuspidata var. bicuspidata NRRL YB-4993]|uniref:rRNA biogenesis protein RRP36 n=1 Tax=Metschnikowia bicuspidata var. bicuspidata NRRL YB-4993 TaxID=869754 RepID=A0A1A0HC12_9ASCO|nr:DUF947-domain-containing protein [Metschnikowia bicuspidata var. bicuspidata NRRL YB-4993]OBA21520.1 DUF947-domain-containing protein [Metschnikowia bicuspidata var. bicuspidata NRRL YB-4993]